MVQDAFSGYHPAVNFLYFLMVLLASMLFMHPVPLCIGLVSAIVYSVMLSGWRALRFSLVFVLPMILVVTLVNPLFSHQGKSVLFYLWENPVTVESCVYGVVTAVMFVTVIVWFSCYNVVMTSDKFIYLFGRTVPSLSLILSMCMRFVPRFKAQVRTIATAQKCIGQDVGTGNVRQRMRHGIRILSVLVSWTLENAIETADSMRARGYGLSGRTHYALYHFGARDKVTLVVLFALSAVVFAGFFGGELSMQYFPVIEGKAFTAFSALAFTSFLALCLTPIAIDVADALRWRMLRKKDISDGKNRMENDGAD